jgi:integrase
VTRFGPRGTRPCCFGNRLRCSGSTRPAPNLSAEETPSEEDRLLAHADPHLRALIVAALSTGCRLGELLSLKWQQIQCDEKGDARWLILPAEQTKTGETRVIPIGPRLRAELVMRRDGPDGEPLALNARVFGNEVGDPVR